MEYFSIDRIADSFAVCVKDDMSVVELPLSVLPKEIKEGSVILFNNGEYVFEKSEEEKRRSRIAELQKRIFDDD